MDLIAECPSPFGVITIFQRKHSGSRSYNQGGFIQSEVDSNNVSLVSYIHAIHGLLCQANSQSVLMIGCGGGTLATMLSKRAHDVTVVDVDPQTFVLARDYFGLPDTITCRVSDGCQFLLTETRTYDAIVVDAYAGDHIPRHMRSCAFFGMARARLNLRGCIFVNVHAFNDLDNAPDRIATSMAGVWPIVRLLDAQGYPNRNAIVMAGGVLRLRSPVLEIRPQMYAEEIHAELRTMQFRSWRTQETEKGL